jgi:hypothetical protein
MSIYDLNQITELKSFNHPYGYYGSSVVCFNDNKAFVCGSGHDPYTMCEYISNDRFV